MGRSSIRVVDAGPEDIETLLVLATHVIETGEAAGRAPMVRLAAGALDQTLRERYHRLLDDPEHRVVLMLPEAGDPVGAAVFSSDVVSALLTMPTVYVSHVVVPGLERDRSVGRALVEAATTFAEEIGAEHVVVGLNPGGRDSNRFFARWGFTPLIIRRIASVPALRRALSDAPTPISASRTRLMARPRVRRVG